MSMDDKIQASFQHADSPFVPGTAIQYAWDSVSLTSILACPRRYQLAVIEGQVSRNPGLAIALVFGILIHTGLEQYHKARFAGQDHDQATHHALAHVLRSDAAQTLPTDEHIEELAESHDADEDDGIHLRNSKVRTRYYLARTLIWYLEHYGAEDNVRTIQLASGAPAVEVSFRIPLPLDVAGHPLVLCGHIDRGCEFNDYLYVADYKTTKSLTQQFFAMFELSHQMTGYSVAGNVVFSEPTRGIIVDGIALQIGGVKLARHFTKRTPGQVAEYFELFKYATGLAEQLHTRYALEGKDYPMNTASCYFCEYKSVCSQAPEYRKNYLAQNFERKPGWNPLANR